MENGSRLLSVLLKASEKAANIARACRQNSALFKILVEEKSAEEKNPRFFQDFKTLADVLIQETIRHDVEAEFPELGKMVQGEENNLFSNTLGETVAIKVLPSQEETTALLSKVMGGDEIEANVLSTEVHRDVSLFDIPMLSEVPSDFRICTDDIGIWIDPIDSTADYVSGGETVDEATGLHLSGLRCVTVLIGVYSKSTGLPVLGVVNQPFYQKENTRWLGVCYWGLVENGVGRSSVSNVNDLTNVILLSRVEDAGVKSKLLDAGYILIESAGAGYKMLSVALGQADAYILSKGSTYKWDTCAPQALLRSLAGEVIQFRTFVTNPNSDDLNLKYSREAKNFSNSSGLIAYRDPKVLEILKRVLCE